MATAREWLGEAAQAAQSRKAEFNVGQMPVNLNWNRAKGAKRGSMLDNKGTPPWQASQFKVGQTQIGGTDWRHMNDVSVARVGVQGRIRVGPRQKQEPFVGYMPPYPGGAGGAGQPPPPPPPQGTPRPAAARPASAAAPGALAAGAPSRALGAGSATAQRAAAAIKPGTTAAGSLPRGPGNAVVPAGWGMQNIGEVFMKKEAPPAFGALGTLTNPFPLTQGDQQSPYPNAIDASSRTAQFSLGANAHRMEQLEPGTQPVAALTMGKDLGPGKRPAGMNPTARMRIRQELATLPEI